MTHRTSIEILYGQLLGDSDFEIAGSDRETGVGYRVSVRHGDIDFAAFSRLDSVNLQSSVEAGLPISIGATLYRIDSSFGSTFTKAVREATLASATTVTIQSHRQIVSVIGKDPLRLSEILKAYLPPTVEWTSDTLVEGSREWGRKIGHAAKDLAGLREATFGVEHLATLERSGEEEAFEAVCKTSIWPAPTHGELRIQGIPPGVAFGIVSCWRMLKNRPTRNPAFRLVFVRDLPPFRAGPRRVSDNQGI